MKRPAEGTYHGGKKGGREREQREERKFTDAVISWKRMGVKRYFKS